jgi:hypothetical protein
MRSICTFAKAEQIALVVITTIGGVTILYFSEILMLRLINIIGEERALGAENVYVQPDGSKLLTNPGAIGCWTLPFWQLDFSCLRFRDG